MNEPDFLSEPAGQALSEPRYGHLLAPALASVTVFITLVGLSHEIMLQPGFRWPNLTTVTRTNGVSRDDSLNEPVLTPGSEYFQAEQKQALAGGRDTRAGQVTGELRVTGQADGPLPDWERPTTDEIDLDELSQAETRQKKPLDKEVKAREENRELAATAPLPAPPALQDADSGRVSSDRPDSSVIFQPAEGYWANTYIPGDPEIRLLNARLAQWDRSWLSEIADLERDVKPVRQPFDAPEDNALALSLMADVSSVAAADDAGSGTRMLLQVGIQGIEHRRGLRPAMNVSLVVDLPDDAPDELRIATRALLDAMLQSKQAGDRFSLVLAGSGLVIEAEDFRFGSLQLAKQHILGRSEASAGTKLSVHDALERAGRMVASSDDPGRPLGSSSVLLISAGSLPEIDQLVGLAHAGATEGVTLSVFPLGNLPENQKVEQLVLAGLGNRRILESPGQARQLVEEELHTASLAVARAARLSVRLLPGVHLIDVIGSERLDEPGAERVRVIESSMDRRLSDNLGIAADRGSDEDGIQIVIPSIFSGDSVTVLLDVMVENPGAIADVSLRYKDLVFLRNGSLQGRLELPGGESQPGPAQRVVMKNRLSLQFSDAVEQAAKALGRNDPDAALAELNALKHTIDQSRQADAAWRDDPELIRDQHVLDCYIQALALPRASAHQSGLADSLHYAAWAKTHRPLEEWNL